MFLLLLLLGQILVTYCQISSVASCGISTVFSVNPDPSNDPNSNFTGANLVSYFQSLTSPIFANPYTTSFQASDNVGLLPVFGVPGADAGTLPSCLLLLFQMILICLKNLPFSAQSKKKFSLLPLPLTTQPKQKNQSRRIFDCIGRIFSKWRRFGTGRSFDARLCQNAWQQNFLLPHRLHNPKHGE